MRGFPFHLPSPLAVCGRLSLFAVSVMSAFAAVPPDADPAAIAPGGQWLVNDPARPKPPKATPKSESEIVSSAKPPKDAIVLFDGKDLSQWNNPNWKVENGSFEAGPKAGAIKTREAFGSARVHVEWWTPNPPQGKRQDAGNSGVFLMGRYEVQVLDNNGNDTYADGMAGAVYGLNPPRVDASRPSGQWQTYDIEFRRPIFGADGKVTRPARISVWFNGVPVQGNYELPGPTNFKRRAFYSRHADKLPLELQEHNALVRYRNIWIQPLAD